MANLYMDPIDFTKIPIKKARLPDCPHLDGLVVVIDVIRAFTTAAFAFAAGAEKIILTGEVEEAFALHKRLANTLLAGEQNGIPIPGFHYDNSPVAISKAKLSGSTIIFRTTSGTQGVVRSTNAGRILVSSFVNAEATLRRIRALSPDKLSFVITGTSRGGSEDLALADYLESKLCHGNADPSPYLEKVRLSPTGLAFSNGTFPYFHKHDLDAVCEIDKFDFALEVFRENGLPVLRPVNDAGKAISG